MLPSLVAHAIGYETIAGAHNIVHAQMRLASFTVFAWYGKCRRLQYCKTNIDAHNTIWVLTCLKDCIVPIWHGLVELSCMCAGYGRVRSLVLRFDLNALPYLPRLILGSSPSRHPRSVVPSRLRPCRSGMNHKWRPGISPVGKGGQSQTVSPP